MKEYADKKPASMIERHCACLCGKSWKTVESSLNHFWNESHARIAAQSTLPTVRAKAEAHFDAQINLTRRTRQWSKPAIHNARPIFAEERLESHEALEGVAMKDDGFEF